MHSNANSTILYNGGPLQSQNSNLTVPSNNVANDAYMNQNSADTSNPLIHYFNTNISNNQNISNNYLVS